MNNFFIIHGSYCNPYKNWIPYLKTQLCWKEMFNLDFYLGLKIEDINLSDYNVRIDEDVLDDFFYNKKFEFIILYEIDPYDNTILYKNDILSLIEDCNKIIDSEIAISENYINDIKKVKALCQKAIDENKNIICIGD